MKFTLDEVELMLRSLRTKIATLTIYNEEIPDLEKLIEDFAIEKGRMMREEYCEKEL